ncbi:MAG: exodeoxyribonuclease V subunit gamma [Defluviitaleaceae bacterium]|nr:exodeoxyribonuclease V subunit gamma [Defluviitaleaceae bacterium]
MAIQFILGGAGTGKTSYVLKEIREKMAYDNAENAPLYYLVPEQFSLQSEKLLLSGGESDDYEAATQVQVLSFNRLAYRLFASFGGPPGQHADDLGKQMLLRKVLFEVADELEYYKSAADKHGFVSELTQTITEMNHYRVNASDLHDRAMHSSPALAAKLRDMALLLTRYREAVAGRYLLTDEMPELLCKKLSENPQEPLPLLDGAYFWVDGFSGFTPQERQVLLHIMKRAAKLTITLTLDAGRQRTAMQHRLFNAPRETKEKLEKIALDSRTQILPHKHMEQNLRHLNATGLSFFVENFGMHNPKPSASTENIEFIAAADRYTSVYATAQRILEMVNENGYRFRDIAILCGDRSHYEKILQTVFDRLKIPMFVDTETDILSHPLTEMIRAALDIPLRNWSYESVFRFLKTRLTNATPETIDILENYALANGINSYRWKRRTFTDEAAEHGRKQLLKALSPFEKMRPDSTETVKNHSRRIFDMLYALRVPETLQEWFDKHMYNGDPATARLHAQIWPKLCEVFDKLVEILGNEKVSLKTFAATLDAGLTQVGLGRIPPTIDQIVLGDIGRSRYPQIKAMIVLGANDGVLPQIPTQIGLFTDHERKTLRNSAIELAPENALRLNEQNYSLYCALSQPSEKLIFIHAESLPNGKPLRPALILTKVKAMFPNIKTIPAPILSDYAAENSIFFAPSELSPATVSQLYGETIYTAATRLEAFARCPFAYYMNYILNAKPRKHYELLPTDLGKLFHDVIAGFTQQVWGDKEKTATPLQDFNRDKIDNIVNTLVDGIDLENSIFDSSARNKHILNKVRRVAAASCWALCEQIKRGEYLPEMIEQDILATISLEDGKTLSLSGRIDRVDIKTRDGTEQIKVIDYKTGGSKFSIAEALQGVQLQLMLYMNAITKSKKTANPGGVFYFPIDDPIINADEELDNTIREEAIYKCFKMSGIEVSAEATKRGEMDFNDFKHFGQEVESKVKEIGKRMTQGDITAEPFTKGQKNPCNHCNYTSVCNCT